MSFYGEERRVSSEFRRWCYDMWYEHIDELIQFSGKPPSYTSKQYFEKYRWWLKREFKSK